MVCVFGYLIGNGSLKGGTVCIELELLVVTEWRKLTSSITSFGDATLMAMPMSASLSRTSWKSRLRLDLALDRARPYSVHKHGSDGWAQWQSLQQIWSHDSPLRDTWCQTSPSCPARCLSAHNCRCPWFLRSEPAGRSAVRENIERKSFPNFQNNMH